LRGAQSTAADGRVTSDGVSAFTLSSSTGSQPHDFVNLVEGHRYQHRAEDFFLNKAMRLVDVDDVTHYPVEVLALYIQA
jgi:hypothetical protein